MQANKNPLTLRYFFMFSNVHAGNTDNAQITIITGTKGLYNGSRKANTGVV